MKIELKNLKSCAWASQETLAYTASVYVDGKRAGECHNEGRGGCTFVTPHDLWIKIGEYAKTLPPLVHPDFGELSYNSDLLLDTLAVAILNARDAKRRAKSAA